MAPCGCVSTIFEVINITIAKPENTHSTATGWIMKVQKQLWECWKTYNSSSCIMDFNVWYWSMSSAKVLPYIADQIRTLPCLSGLYSVFEWLIWMTHICNLFVSQEQDVIFEGSGRMPVGTGRAWGMLGEFGKHHQPTHWRQSISSAACPPGDNVSLLYSLREEIQIVKCFIIQQQNLGCPQIIFFIKRWVPCVMCLKMLFKICKYMVGFVVCVQFLFCCVS